MFWGFFFKHSIFLKSWSKVFYKICVNNFSGCFLVFRKVQRCNEEITSNLVFALYIFFSFSYRIKWKCLCESICNRNVPLTVSTEKNLMDKFKYLLFVQDPSEKDLPLQVNWLREVEDSLDSTSKVKLKVHGREVLPLVVSSIVIASSLTATLTLAIIVFFPKKSIYF